MSQVTKPMMLDETGQAIVTALGNIGNAVQPTNVCVDLPVSIPANGWTNSAPYTYTYTHSKITAECGVTVEFESGASNTDCLAMDYEKVAGGVMFTVKTKPSSAVPVIIHVLNAEAEGITSVSADMVSTSAISGSSNVEQALGALNSNMANFPSHEAETYIESGQTETFTPSKMFSIMVGQYGTSNFMYTFFRASSTNVSVAPIKASNDMSISATNGVVSITNNANVTYRYQIINV